MIDSNPVYESINWYVLNHIATTPARNSAQRTVDRFNDAGATRPSAVCPVVCSQGRKGWGSVDETHAPYLSLRISTW